MKYIFNYLRKNWFKYGFETMAILVGILGAFALSTWQEISQEKEREIEYLENLLLDLEGQLENIENQKRYEDTVRVASEEILEIIKEAPYDISQLNFRYSKLGRRTFVNSGPVFEDLKYSGHLSLITDAELRISLFKYYQRVDYAETVIATNNSSYSDRILFEVFGMAVHDQGYAKSITVGQHLDFSLEVEPFKGAHEIIHGQLENDKVRLHLHNLIAMRGRTSSLHAHLMKDLERETQLLITQLEKVLGY